MREALILAAALGLLALEFSTPALARAPTYRVLGMRVEGVDLSAKDRDDLFQVVQTKLRLYPTLTLLKPPEEELTAIMLDLECFEIDVECLTKLGKEVRLDQGLLRPGRPG